MIAGYFNLTKRTGVAGMLNQVAPENDYFYQAPDSQIPSRYGTAGSLNAKREHLDTRRDRPVTIPNLEFFITNAGESRTFLPG